MSPIETPGPAFAADLPGSLPMIHGLEDTSSLVGKSQHSRAEWEAIKNIIEIYYVDNNYTLPALMGILSEEPWNFHASQKMFKTQFKRWGFEKNVTKNRVRELLRPDIIRNGARKAIGIDRIDRYLKRKKLQKKEDSMPPPPPPRDSTNIPDIPELGGRNTISEISELDSTPINLQEPCEFAAKGNNKYRLAFHDTEGLNQENFTSIGPFSESVYRADSWGSQEYYEFNTSLRKCGNGCACRSLSPGTHAFHVVIVRPHSIRVEILSRELLSTLIDIAKFYPEDMARVKFNPSIGAYSEYVDGLALLRSYRCLKESLPVGSSARGFSFTKGWHELRLLVEGFLEDGNIWSLFRYEKLQSTGVLDRELLRLFMRQRLLRGIQSLDNGFQAVENSAGLGSMELDSIVQYDHNHGLGTLDTISTDSSGRESNETQTVIDESVLDYDEFATYGFLPTNHNIAGFYDLSRPQPLLPQLIGSVHNIDILPLETLNGGLGSVDTPAELFGEWYTQTELDDNLVSACHSGTTETARSLIALGANVNAYTAFDENRCTPTIAAIESNHSEIVHLLIQEGAKLNLRALSQKHMEAFEYTPIYAAVHLGNYELVKSLLDNGADINAFSTIQTPGRTSNLTALTEAAKGNRQEIFELLLMKDTTFQTGLKSIEFVPPGNSSAARRSDNLISAASTGNTAGILEALRTGSNINAVSFRGTALSAAARKKKGQAIKMLLKHGANVQVTILYLTRSGFHKTSERLLKIVYGSDSNFQNLHKRFIHQYKQVSRACTESNAANLQVFSRQNPSYRRAWSTGIDIMKKVCNGDAPTEVSDTAAFLAVARAIAETLVGSIGDMTMIDKFDNDLSRWQQLFPFEEDLLSYRKVVQLVWEVKLSEAIFYDTDIEDQETLDRFRDLISMLINGACEPLGLDGHGFHSLDSSMFRWRKEKAASINTIPCGPRFGNILQSSGDDPVTPTQRLELRDRGYSLAYPEPNSFGNIGMVTAPQRNMHRHSDYLPGANRVAESLIRGAIFAITFTFLRVIQRTLGISGSLGDLVGAGTLAQRMSAFRRYFILPSIHFTVSCALFTSEQSVPSTSSNPVIPPDVTSPPVVASSTSLPPSRCLPTEQPSQQWYNLLGHGGYWM
ncbi:hypothetical protein F5X99DRAFT_389178 [Biscogniauxia marginata]|nr:hypothetical protein F5X99DRAFT_389178 [Biscogniauxia marginata]